MTRGRLEVIYGPMFSGKTDELIRRFREGPARSVALKPELDRRHDARLIVSHSGERIPALPVADVSEARSLLGGAEAAFIDEGQFLAPAFAPLLNELAESIHVVVAGLDLDFRGRPFGVMPELVASASAVTALTATCARCGRPATRTARRASSPDHSSVILLGGAEAYEPLCVDCFRNFEEPRNTM